MIQKFYMDGSRKIPHRKVARTILPKVMRITEGNILPRVISQIDSTSINVATAEILLIEILAIFQQL